MTALSPPESHIHFLHLQQLWQGIPEVCDLLLKGQNSLRLSWSCLLSASLFITNGSLKCQSCWEIPCFHSYIWN